MNAKEHAKSEHAASEVFHLHKSKHHQALSKAHARLADQMTKADDDDAASCHRELSQIHAAMSSMENERADHHRQTGTLIDGMTMDQPFMRAAGTDDLSKLIPDNIRGIIPPPEDEDRPGRSVTTGLTAIPRPGSPQRGFERANVPIELQKIIGSLEDEEKPA